MKLARLLIAAALLAAAPRHAAPQHRDRCPRRRLLLGHGMGVRACEGRHERRLRLCRRQRRRTPITTRSARKAPATPRRCGSPTIPRRSATPSCSQIYFTVAHDPTEVNRQGPDVGTSYRSAIFPQSPQQARFAKAFIAQAQRGARLQGADRDAASRAAASTRPRPTTRASRASTPIYPYIVVQRPPEGRRAASRNSQLFTKR